ncbi:MAG TPA: cysteine hydrolase [Candidatus Atribacteria bacterium]|nr:cysteine hydrolase [Candidatus Atribacteria bacterium]
MMKNIALLVIDVQKIYSLNHSRLKVNHVESVVENINKIIRYFENKNLPIIYIRHLHNPDGSDAGRMYDFSGKTRKIGFKKGSLEAEYIDDLIIIKGATEIIKNRYNSFFNTDLADLLNKLKINRVVIVGFMTNFCCESTARDAHDRDYYVDFIIDATGTPDLGIFNQEQIKLASAQTLSAGYVHILKTEEFLKI